MYIDVHSHLDHAAIFDILDSVIADAKKAGLSKIITAGIDKESNRKVIEIAKKYDIVKYSLGIYPQDALKSEMEHEKTQFKETDIEQEIKFIKTKKPFAIGEVGLDFKHGKDKESQIKLFKKMIDLAKELEVPLIVHSRGAEQQCIEILEEMKAKKVVMHCFGGKMSLVKRIEKKGWYLSIPTNILTSEHFQQIVKQTDISRLLTESDAPFLGPAKTFPNQPKNVVLTIKKIAEIKNMDEHEVKNIIFMNFQRLFY